MVDEKGILDLRNRIAEEFQPKGIILFGSYASGVARADADLDILIVFRHGASGPKRSAEILRRLNPRIPVDLVVRTSEEINRRLQANDFYLAEILNHGRTKIVNGCSTRESIFGVSELNCLYRNDFALEGSLSSFVGFVQTP